MSKIQKQIDDLAKSQPWNHRIELDSGLFTSNEERHVREGTNIVKWNRIKPYLDSLDLKGKNVLDVGASDGFFTVELARRGANVVSIELNEKRIEKLEFVISTLDLKSQVSILSKDIYEIDFSEYPKFDLALCMGFLHRVPDMYSVMRNISKVSYTVIYEWKALNMYSSEFPFLMFDGKSSDLNDKYVTCYFTPNMLAVLKISQTLGKDYYQVLSNTRRSIVAVSSLSGPTHLKFSGVLHRSFLKRASDFLHRVLREFKYFFK